MGEWDSATAEWYANNYGECATNRLAVEALELEPDAVVVDVGCGTGCALRHVSSKVTRGVLIGVDPVPRMLEIARERAAQHPAGGRIEFREGAAESLPVQDDCADVVLAFDSFDHWSDRSRGLSEILRVLRTDGQLVVVKDCAVPGGAKARAVLADALAKAGFVVADEQSTTADNVSFTMWVWRVASGGRVR
jgi:ubiquinone/menaquinone biosynthesis C-methylase UbiE